MRSELWIREKRQRACDILRQAAEIGEFGFNDVLAAFHHIAFDGPTCAVALQLAEFLRPISVEALMGAASDGQRHLSHLGEQPRKTLRLAVDDAIRSAPSLVEAATVFERSASDFVSQGEFWIDRPRSDLAAVALALQAIEWAVRPPQEQVIRY